MSTSSTQDIQIEIVLGTMKSRRVRCMKFFITLLCIICLLFGLILMTVCAMNMREEKMQPAEQLSEVSRGVLSFLLTLCIALVVTAIVGCVGALREHVRTLYVHAGFFIFLMAVELVVAVGASVLSVWIGSSRDLRVQFYKNTTDEDETARYNAFWDELQYDNQCCGVDGPQDYAIIRRDIPPSCCARAHPLRDGGARRHLHSSCLAERSFYMRGCEDALRIKKAYKGNLFIAAGIIFTFIQILCIVLAIWMGRTVRSERRKLQANLQAHFES